jgi:hypothetical protein
MHKNSFWGEEWGCEESGFITVYSSLLMLLVKLFGAEIETQDTAFF